MEAFLEAAGMLAVAAAAAVTATGVAAAAAASLAADLFIFLGPQYRGRTHQQYILLRGWGTVQ